MAWGHVDIGLMVLVCITIGGGGGGYMPCRHPAIGTLILIFYEGKLFVLY